MFSRLVPRSLLFFPLSSHASGAVVDEEDEDEGCCDPSDKDETRRVDCGATSTSCRHDDDDDDTSGDGRDIYHPCGDGQGEERQRTEDNQLQLSCFDGHATTRTATHIDAAPSNGMDNNNKTGTSESNNNNRHKCFYNSSAAIEDSMEQLGVGPFQYLVVLAAGLCFASDAMIVMLLSFITVVLREEWGLSSSGTALITSILFVGALLGSLYLGPLADTIGRRPVFLLAATTIASFATLAAVLLSSSSSSSSSYWTFLAMIFMVGIGVGGLTIPFDILSEFLPTQFRGTYLLLIEYFWTIGCLYVVCVASVTLRRGNPHNDGDVNDSIRGCQLAILLSAVPCWISLLLGYLVVPESAKWLCSQGRGEEALLIVQQAARMNGVDLSVMPTTMSSRSGAQSESTTVALLPVETSVAGEVEEQGDGVEERDREATICDLLQPKWRSITLRLWVAWFAFAFGYYGTVLSTTKIFERTTATNAVDRHHDNGYYHASTSVRLLFWRHPPRSSSSSSSSPHSSSYDFDYMAIFVSSAAELVGTTLVIYTIDRFGRIKSQVVTFVLAGLSISALCFVAAYYHHQQQPHEITTAISSTSSGLWQWYALVGLGFSSRVFEMAATCVSWVYTSEIFPTELRGTGHSTANAMARLGASFCPLVIQGSSFMTIGMVLLASHTIVVLCIGQLPETTGNSSGIGSRHQPVPQDNDNDDVLTSAVNNGDA